ncbi:DUF1990 domain-containing protein [Chloracidobacterium sp. MS 40/45]|uniref:DUF1990 family protein n=1 Tax=Chloracidobacterium aggregatum TaxID=2851959 RepID=UPI001B8C22AA|nr:DUF1990 domain-containing protein [Chloracidobacterium aggregatum]QUV99617.1 DUF1990 domain-containing protein [Chloracidobacterium sp. MS 40/45]
MFLFTPPTAEQLKTFLESQTRQPLTYTAEGATRLAAALPDGYTVDHRRVALGSGETVFRRACAALRRWEMFNLGWLTCHPRAAPVEVGQVVAIVPWHFGFWSLNACRIVYVIAEERRFGFGYGTLPAHVESGEERFLIEWEASTDAVAYDILAFSRPAHPLTQLAYPVTRLFQWRFAADSGRAMRQAVVAGEGIPEG